MDISKLREEEQILLLEERMIDRCDEISEISYALLVDQFVNRKNKNRYLYRLKDLRAEMQLLWAEYAKTVKTKVPDLEF